MKKTSDLLLEVFIWVWQIFFCSLVLPLFFGISILLIIPVASWFMNHLASYILASVAIGICLNIYFGNKLFNKEPYTETGMKNFEKISSSEQYILMGILVLIIVLGMLKII